jgi:chorismate-pyruvate lyase
MERSTLKVEARMTNATTRNTESAMIAYPLSEFYARSGLTLPPLDQVEGEAVPAPYKSLLVHERDMTSTLETFHHGGIHLRLVSREQRGEEYFREVVLALDGSERPVEFGAIQINLGRFPTKAREDILEERFPLGHILKDHQIQYFSRPKAFLRIASDKTINGLLHLTGAHRLYGRRNTLLDLAGQPLAEIVEILPPTVAPALTPKKSE